MTKENLEWDIFTSIHINISKTNQLIFSQLITKKKEERFKIKKKLPFLI
jgi:hypothetical protein